MEALSAGASGGNEISQPAGKEEGKGMELTVGEEKESLGPPEEREIGGFNQVTAIPALPSNDLKWGSFRL